VSITLVQPTATDTPFPQNARNYLDVEPKLPNPMIEPQQVADAILEAAVTPTRAKKVGGAAVLNTLMAKLLPGFGEKMTAKQADSLHYDEPPRHPEGTLNQPGEATGVAGLAHGTGGKK
jgi:short-subunit dehydrogenase